jgi:hypothetical protein
MASIRWIFLELDTSYFPRIRYIPCEFGSERSVPKDTLPGEYVYLLLNIRLDWRFFLKFFSLSTHALLTLYISFDWSIKLDSFLEKHSTFKFIGFHSGVTFLTFSPSTKSACATYRVSMVAICQKMKNTVLGVHRTFWTESWLPLQGTSWNLGSCTSCARATLDLWYGCYL